MMYNLLDVPAASLPEELVDVLVSSSALRIERIVSTGHASAEGFVYDQEEHEFVLLLQGAAQLWLDGADGVVDLRPGDWLQIEAHRRHRVVWTSAEEPTIWLAVFHR